MLCWPIQLLPAWFSGANNIYFHLTGRQLHCHSQPCLPCLVLHSSCQTLLLLFSRIISLERVPTYVASHQPEFHKGLLSLLAPCPIFREVPPSLPVPPVCLASRLFRVVQPLLTPTRIVTASCLIILQSCRPRSAPFVCVQSFFTLRPCHLVALQTCFVHLLWPQAISLRSQALLLPCPQAIRLRCLHLGFCLAFLLPCLHQQWQLLW